MRRLTLVPVLALTLAVWPLATPAHAPPVPTPDATGTSISIQITDHGRIDRPAHGGRPPGGIEITYPSCPSEEQVRAFHFFDPPSDLYGYVGVTPVTDPELAHPGGEPTFAYEYVCAVNGQRTTRIWYSVTEPADADVPTFVDPQVLAQAAYDHARDNLPGPRISTSPGGDQVVQFPTWLWVEEGDWLAYSVTAATPGQSATVTATPVTVHWATGDGGGATCASPGTPYRRANPRATSPDCGYTYRHASTGRPGERFTLTATVTWTVTWEAEGAVTVTSGTMPSLGSSSSTTRRVVEVQTIN